MTSFRLIVKGEDIAARNAAEAHQVQIIKSQPGGYGDTYLEVTGKIETIIEWFNENQGFAPFSDGTLLFYSEILY